MGTRNPWLPGEPAPKGEAEAEPEPESEATDTSAAKQAVPESQPPSDLPAVSDNYFSIRGEVVKYSPAGGTHLGQDFARGETVTGGLQIL